MIENRILVVDDEKMICELFSDLLTSNGYQVITAESGEQALKILEDTKINVMFLDQQLPGMNGQELCKTIKKDHPVTVIYAMSGNASLFASMDWTETGFDDFFPKPVGVKSIIDAAEFAFFKIEYWRSQGNEAHKYQETTVCR